MRVRTRPPPPWPPLIVPASVGAALAVGTLVANAALNAGPCGIRSGCLFEVCTGAARSLFGVGAFGALGVLLAGSALIGAGTGIGLWKVFQRDR